MTADPFIAKALATVHACYEDRAAAVESAADGEPSSTDYLVAKSAVVTAQRNFDRIVEELHGGTKHPAFLIECAVWGLKLARDNLNATCMYMLSKREIQAEQDLHGGDAP